MIDVTVVPDRLDRAIAETIGHDVLHGLLAQVVVDAINLVLFKALMQDCVQPPGRIQIPAKGFFNDNASPAIVAFLRQPGLAQFGSDHTNETGGRRQVEKIVARRTLLLIYLKQKLFQLFITFCVTKIARHVVGFVNMCIPECLVKPVADK